MKDLERPEVAALNKFVRPVLASLDFEEIGLKDCMWPKPLFRRDRIWFSLSWDWRDQYLDACLGRLFWFRDVMPRVVVIGDYSHWDASITWDAVSPKSDFEVVFRKIGRLLPDAVSRVDNEYLLLLDEFKRSRGKNVAIDDYIGEEASIDSLMKYRA